MGNYTQASYCAVSILLHSIISGRPLDALAKEVESFAPYIREGNYGGIVLSIWEQTMLNLLHASWDSGAEVLKDLMVEARETNNEKAIGQIFVARLFLSYLFNRYGAAVDIILERDQHPVKLHSAPLMYETLFGALSCLAAPHKLGREESRTMAQDALKTMQAWQYHSKWNFQHRATFLQAEIASFDGNLQEAAARYDEAVTQASKHGFVHENVRSNLVKADVLGLYSFLSIQFAFFSLFIDFFQSFTLGDHIGAIGNVSSTIQCQQWCCRRRGAHGQGPSCV